MWTTKWNWEFAKHILILWVPVREELTLMLVVGQKTGEQFCKQCFMVCCDQWTSCFSSASRPLHGRKNAYCQRLITKRIKAIKHGELLTLSRELYSMPWRQRQSLALTLLTSTEVCFLVYLKRKIKMVNSAYTSLNPPDHVSRNIPCLFSCSS